MNIFRLIPLPVLGILLAYVGFQHILLARDLRGVQNLAAALVVLALTIWTGNLAIGFISGSIFFYAWGWFSSHVYSYVN
jgi:branched-subunit amino acid transport protein AzlD